MCLLHARSRTRTSSATTEWSNYAETNTEEDLHEVWEELFPPCPSRAPGDRVPLGLPDVRTPTGKAAMNLIVHPMHAPRIAWWTEGKLSGLRWWVWLMNQPCWKLKDIWEARPWS
jgi:hypothetical protein